MEYHSNCTVISHLWLGSHLCFPIQVSGVPPQHPQRTWGATGLFTNIQRSDVCLKHLKFHQFFLHQKTSEKGEGHEDHEDHGFCVHVVSIPRPSAATTSVMKICGRHMWPQPWHMSHVTFGILFARIFPYWRASMGHDEKRATLSTPKDMENHSRELWLVFQLVSSWYLCLQQTRLPMDDALPKAAMRAGRKLREAWWDAVQQRSVGDSVPNKTSHGCYEPVTSLFYCSVDDRSQCLNQWIGFRDNLQENHGFSLWNIWLCKFSLKPIHCLKGSQVFRLSSLLLGESAAKCKHWDATGWALGN